MFKLYKTVLKQNGFHARINLILLIFKKKSIFKIPFKVLKKIIIQIGYHCEIHPDRFTTVKAIATARLPHPYLIIVHRTARIDIDFTIFKGVTIGVIESKTLRAATIGKNVYVGCNSSILDLLNIGNNVMVGAHTLVLKSITANTTVTGFYK